MSPTAVKAPQLLRALFLLELLPVLSLTYKLYIQISIKRNIILKLKDKYHHQNLIERDDILQQKQKIFGNNFNKNINMLALDDDISQFEKLAMTTKDDTMSIDEKFFGGGVKVKDLIEENSFIIKEMRKMKNVFLNYCKLNDKVYKKIIEHEVNASQQYNKVTGIAAGIDRLLSTFTEDMKQLKETTLIEMHKNRQLTDALIESVKKKMDEKIGQNGFDQRVKKLIDQYEEENTSTPNIVSDNNNTDTEGPIKPQIQPQGKKKRGLTMQDIQTFKAQLTPLIDAVSVRVDEHKLKLCEFGKNFEALPSKFQKINQQIQWFSQDISQVKKQIQQSKKIAEENDQKIVNQLRQKTCEKQWERRLSQFEALKVHIPIQKLSQRTIRANLDIKDEIKEIYPKIKTIQNKIETNKNNIHKLEENIKINKSNIAKGDKKIEQVRQLLQNEVQVLKKQHMDVVEEINKQKKKSEQGIFQKIKQINQRVNKLSSTIEEQVLKKVQKTVGKQIKQIRTQIYTINNKISEIKCSLRQNYDQVNHVQHAISSKANFTDVVQAFDRKADKDDLNDLQEYIKMESPKTNALGLMFKSNSQRVNGKMKKKKSSFSRIGTPNCTRAAEEDSTRVFHMEWDTPNQNSQAMKSFKQSTNKIRHKSLRPSTANTLFLL